MSPTTTAWSPPAPSPSSPEGPPPAPRGASKSPTRALVELVVVAGAVTLLAVTTGWGDLLIVVACLVVMVMLHELGHLLAAKRGGMKVTEYFLGFGPRLWSFRRGETEYGIKALALRRLREDPGHDQPRRGRSGRRAPYLPTAVVPQTAPRGRGRIGHALPHGLRPPLGPASRSWGCRTTTSSKSKPSTRSAGKPGPAQVAGLRPGDVVVSVDGRSVQGDFDRFESAIQRHPDSPVQLVVLRDGHDRTVTVVPANGRVRTRVRHRRPEGERALRDHRCDVGLARLSAPNPLVAVGHATTELGVVTWGSIVGRRPSVLSERAGLTAPSR